MQSDESDASAQKSELPHQTPASASETDQSSRNIVATQRGKRNFTGSVDLLAGNITSSLWRFATPMIFSFMINSLYGFVDLYFVSQLGTDAQAALGFGNTTYFLLFTLISGFANGTGIVVARRFGARQMQDARETALQSVVYFSLLAFAVAAILYLGLDILLSMFSAEAAVFSLTEKYLGVIILASPFNFMFFQVSSIYRSIGNSFFPMLLLILSAGLNAVLDPFLIFGWGPFPELGITGAGISTFVAQFVSAALAIGALFMAKGDMRLTFRFPKLRTSVLGAVTRIGVPATLQMLTVSISRLVIFNIAGKFGADVSAAFTIGMTIDFFVFMPIFAMGVTMQTVTSQNLGAGQIKRIWTYFKIMSTQNLMLIGSLGLIVYFFAEPISTLFSADPVVISESVAYLRITAFSYPFFLLAIITSRLLSGAGFVILSMSLVAGSLAIVQIPVALFLAFPTGLEQQGVWYGILIAYVVMAALGYGAVKVSPWYRGKV
jgi:putative MATE family efflux protein